MKKDSRTKLNNAGFSLVELLIAVTILAIIVTPLLHSFITAMRTNSKARNSMHATAVAENVMEEFEAYGVDGMWDKYTAAGYDTQKDVDMAGTAVADSGTYRFVGTDASTTTGTYDVVVYLDPSAYETGINSKGMVDIQNLAGTMNAVFMENEEDLNQAYNTFYMRAEDSAAKKAEIKRETYKTINIKIDSKQVTLDVGDSSPIVVDTYVVSASTQYFCPESILYSGQSGSYPQNSNEYIIYSNEDDVREQAEKIKEKREAGETLDSGDVVVSRLANIIIGIQSGASEKTSQDIITVDNSDNVDTNIFLVQQESSVYTSPCRLHYTLIEKQPGWVASQRDSFNSHCSLRTNLLNKTTVTYEFRNASNGSKLYGECNNQGGKDVLSIMQADELTPVKAYDRIYDITVSIYPKDTLTAGTSASPLITMTGTVTSE